MTQTKHCLLIGNSRWHWAIHEEKKWLFVHESPDSKKLKEIGDQLCKWAAVGPIPKNVSLDSSKRINIKNIPLLKLPNWIGVDRALASWAAFKKAKNKNLHSHGILIADAGTVLSITRITTNGEFAGGQLLPGLHLQRLSMSNGAEMLRPIQCYDLPKTKFPISTEEAILRGSYQGLLGALIEAQREAKSPLWLCGGDSKILFEELRNNKVEVYHEPDLVLKAMIEMNHLLN